MTGPSDKAIEAAARVIYPSAHHVASEREHIAEGLRAAYPIIRADLVAEVVAELRVEAPHILGWRGAADLIERKFGGAI